MDILSDVKIFGNLNVDGSGKSISVTAYNNGIELNPITNFNGQPMISFNDGNGIGKIYFGSRIICLCGIDSISYADERGGNIPKISIRRLTIPAQCSKFAVDTFKSGCTTDGNFPIVQAVIEDSSYNYRTVQMDYSITLICGEGYEVVASIVPDASDRKINFAVCYP